MRVKTVINRVVMDVPKVNLSSSSIPAKQAEGGKEMRKQASSAGLKHLPRCSFRPGAADEISQGTDLQACNISAHFEVW